MEIPRRFLKEATDADLDLAWTESYERGWLGFGDFGQIPVNYEVYGYEFDTMVNGTFHDYAFWRPLVVTVNIFIPESRVLGYISEGWGLYEEITDDVLGTGHPLGEYHSAYPTIKVTYQWGYLPTSNTHSFFAP